MAMKEEIQSHLSQNLLSKSWGGYPGETMLQRHVSEVSNITHAGYLLKRSNLPFVNPIQSLTALEENDEDKATMNLGRQHDLLKEEFSPDERNSSSSCLDSSLRNQPQHLMPATETAVPIRNSVFDTDLNQSMDFVESFFGVELPPLPKSEPTEGCKELIPVQSDQGKDEPNNDTLTRQTTKASSIERQENGTLARPASTATARQQSSPIKVNSKSNSSAVTTVPPEPDELQHNESSTNPINRLPAESKRAVSVCALPQDVIDPATGHLWRSKYCVLEGGVLYFYRHQSDAESAEARSDRLLSTSLLNQKEKNNNCASPTTPSAKRLSKSPIPASSLRSLLDSNSVTSSQQSDASAVSWEKRVALDCVGAVRSAEQDYGKNSFELCAIDNDENDIRDTLVLRAGSANEMNEWLFQFHRSISYFVMNIMDQVGFTSLPVGDIHHSAFSHKPLVAPIFKEMSPSINNKMILKAVASPRNYPRAVGSFSGSHTPPLSHGHGRNSMHRRRILQGDNDSLNPVLSSSVPAGAPSLPFLPNSAVLENPIDVLTPLRHQPHQTLPWQNSQQEGPHSSPELSAPRSATPETERPPPGEHRTGKYLPPHLRNRSTCDGVAALASPSVGKYIPPHMRKKNGGTPPGAKEGTSPRLRSNSQDYVATTKDRSVPFADLAAVGESPTLCAQEDPMLEFYFEKGKSEDDERSNDSVGMAMMFEEPEIEYDEVIEDFSRVKLGGCADPSVVADSILHERYKPRKASRLGKVRTEPFGLNSVKNASLCWEIGAFSECGIRESNEDSYLIANDLCEQFKVLDASSSTVWNELCSRHTPCLLGIFDGHCGDHAARFAGEKLIRFIHEESSTCCKNGISTTNGGSNISSEGLSQIESILRCAIASLDYEFCKLCVQDGRTWESGTTALIAVLVDEHLVIANLGDARGVVSRSLADSDDVSGLEESGWTELPPDDYSGSRRCVWKEVTAVHTPSRKDETQRIEKANGWITTETEIPIGQFQRMDLCDQDVIDILQRCFADRYQPSPKAAAPQRILHISRVCGELAVSRAIGDRDFKAAFNYNCNSSTEEDHNSAGEENRKWDCPLLLPYPENHSRSFVGNLVSNEPDFQFLRVGEAGVSDEFLLLACDGLWDVMDADDAVRVTRNLLFEKQWRAKDAAARLAELAIHLGSSDNITVIVIRFSRKNS